MALPLPLFMCEQILKCSFLSMSEDTLRQLGLQSDDVAVRFVSVKGHCSFARAFHRPLCATAIVSAP